MLEAETLEATPSEGTHLFQAEKAKGGCCTEVRKSITPRIAGLSFLFTAKAHKDGLCLEKGIFVPEILKLYYITMPEWS